MSGKKDIKILGIDKGFVDMLTQPSKCSESVGFRLDSKTLVARGIASFLTQLHTLWEYNLTDDITGGIDNMDKDVIVYLHKTKDFIASLKFFGDDIDMTLSCIYDLATDAYVAKRISITDGSLTINFACAEIVLGYVEYTPALFEEKTTIDNVAADFVMTSGQLKDLTKLAGIGSFDTDDKTLHIETVDGVTRAFNNNFSSTVDLQTGGDFEKISIQAKLVNFLDTDQNWNVRCGRLENNGSIWVFSNADETIHTVIGGVKVLDEDSEENQEINDMFKSQFDRFMEDE